MIMDGAEGLIFKLSALGLYITAHTLACQEQANKSARFFPVYECGYSGNRPSYMMLSSP